MLTPDQFAEAPVYTLLAEAAKGRIGIDQRWYAAILTRGQDAVAEINRFGTENHEDDPIDLDEDLLLLLHKLKSPSAVPYFVEYFRRHPDGVSDILIEALLPIRQAALEPLIQLYDELSEDDAGEVAFALASFRIRDDRVLRILLDRLEYDTGDGALCLGLYGDPAAKTALEKMLTDVDDEHLKSDISDAIEQLGRGEDEDVQVHDLEIEEMVPKKAFPEFEVLDEPDLLELLQSGDPEYRFAAAAGFVNQDKTAKTVSKLLEVAQNDPDVTVRAKCWEALGTEVSENEEVSGALLKKLQDESAPRQERVGALAGLGQLSNEPPIRQYAEQFYEDPTTRAAAMSAMWNSLDKSFAKYFPKHLDDPDIDVRKQAISGVGYLGINDAAERLRTFFSDEDLRANAIFAYALAIRAEVTPGRVRGLFRRIEQAVGALSEAETELVEVALDERLMLNGHKQVFRPQDDEESDIEDVDESPAPVTAAKVGRNDPCPCGSGKKYKKCHGA